MNILWLDLALGPGLGFTVKTKQQYNGDSEYCKYFHHRRLLRR